MRWISSSTGFANKKGAKGVLSSLCSASQNNTVPPPEGLTNLPFITLHILVPMVPQEQQIPKDTFWNAAAQCLHVKVIMNHRATNLTSALTAALAQSPSQSCYLFTGMTSTLHTWTAATCNPSCSWSVRRWSFLWAESTLAWSLRSWVI